MRQTKFLLTLLMVLALIVGAVAQETPSRNPPSPVASGTLSIGPVDPTVSTGGTIVFTAQTDGRTDTQVSWSVNGVAGGNQDSGTIATDGRYTAPATVPDNAPKITATSLTDKTRSSNPLSVTITASSCPPTDSRRPSPCLTIEPPTALVRVGDRNLHLSLKVANWPSEIRTVKWFVNGALGGNKTTGTIQGIGKDVAYSAPVAVPAKKVEVKAVVTMDIDRAVTAQIIVVAKYVSARCFSIGTKGKSDSCVVKDFDRLDGDRGSFDKQQVKDDTPARWVTAVNSSKAMFTGSLLDLDLPNGANESNCKSYDWKIVTQTRESPNVLIYNPSDIGSGVCVGSKFVIALPVRVMWATVSGFPQQSDPQRSPPADVAAFKDCWGNTVPATIAPCDRNVATMKGIYKSGWVYTHFGQAGSAQGSMSLSPVIGAGQLSFDVQADPAYRLGPGWLNIPLIFEKSTSQGSNLDALIVGLAYDLKAVRIPNFVAFSHIVVRKPQFQIRSSVEIAPTTPHDKNWVEAGTLKFPLVFNFHQQPSAFTAYPVMGVEGGSHFDTHLAEDDAILRGVAGVDGSFRWPFNVTHNFLGSSPITFEYSYRIRWLAYAEPTTDVANNGTEVLAAGRRSFLRGSLIAPLTPNLQFQVTALRGSLPPDFRVLGNTVAIGLTFTNPGSSEH
jgi:hypothetical protein